jgi:hypothetical protein
VLRSRRAVAALAAVIAALGLVALGRVTAATDGVRARGHDAGYLEGLAAGHAAGVAEGRAYQATLSVPKESRRAARAAFASGYAAGANDAFGDYDGGWYLGRPYVVVLAKGRGAITYRIASRTPMAAGTDYYSCPRPRVVCERRP